MVEHAPNIISLISSALTAVATARPALRQARKAIRDLKAWRLRRQRKLSKAQEAK